MGKLRLDLDAIEVESFDTGTAKGSVVAYDTGALCVEGSDEDTCAGGGQPTIGTCAGMYTCPKTGPCACTWLTECGTTCTQPFTNPCRCF